MVGTRTGVTGPCGTNPGNLGEDRLPVACHPPGACASASVAPPHPSLVGSTVSPVAHASPPTVPCPLPGPCHPAGHRGTCSSLGTGRRVPMANCPPCHLVTTPCHPGTLLCCGRMPGAPGGSGSTSRCLSAGVQCQCWGDTRVGTLCPWQRVGYPGRPVPVSEWLRRAGVVRASPEGRGVPAQGGSAPPGRAPRGVTAGLARAAPTLPGLCRRQLCRAAAALSLSLATETAGLGWASHSASCSRC